ncbi:quinol:cytochrome C oxidoreductase [Candidatus Amoebophilus asiaticus]|nr:quinol:cytochrome C oxidoreductase [Candidatus Amoebophilus asiaticus]
MNEQFILEQKHKKWAFILIGIGILALIIGIFLYKDSNPTRIWANILLSGWFFTVISLTGVFFVAVNYIAQAGWATCLKRIPEAMGSFLPIGAVVMLIITAGIYFHWHHLYHWAQEGIMVEGSEHYDKIIAGKAAFLNFGFFACRGVAYFLIWILLYNVLRKLSLREDVEGGVTLHKKAGIYSALFIVFFGITTSTSAWDYIMSIDTHWFSTVFGWYNFASMFVATFAVITLIVINLKKQGYLSVLNENHFHDLGKFMFAFSIFWGYLWFVQFLLIWYANIPEETFYYVERFEHYKLLFFVNLIINFFFPFLMLMDRDAKRNPKVLTIVAIGLVIGHWLDFYLMIMPGTVGENYGFGILEIGLFLGFAGLFGLMVGRALSKAPLIPQNHPFLEESVHHHV